MKNILYWVGVVVGSFLLTYVLGALGYAFICWEAPPWDISEWDALARWMIILWGSFLALLVACHKRVG